MDDSAHNPRLFIIVHSRKLPSVGVPAKHFGDADGSTAGAGHQVSAGLSASPNVKADPRLTPELRSLGNVRGSAIVF
jgi:hypothetical protein